MKTAFIFPGQGSQIPGMGKEFAENFPCAREVFEEIDDVLNQNLSRVIFEGPEETLTLTENAQPAIMATSMAMLRVLEKECGLNVHAGLTVAGHSLGEYSALCAARSFTVRETALLLRTRGTAMEKAVPAGQGGMAALLGLTLAQAEEVAAEAAHHEICSVANDNADGQVVISGNREAIARAIDIAKAKGAKRAVALAVSGPFHSVLMAPAAETMREALNATPPRTPVIPLVANVTATSTFSVQDIQHFLVEQVTGRVRWRESVHYMKAHGVERCVEIGAGKVLSGLIKRIEPDIQTLSVSTLKDLEHASF